MLSKTGRIIQTILTFFFIFLFCFLSFCLQILSSIIFLPIFIFKPKFKDILMSAIFIYPQIFFIVFLNPFWRFKILKKPVNFDLKNTIIFCNHSSASDPYILLASLFPHVTKFVLKASLLKIPFIGYSLWMSNDPKITFTKDKGGWGIAKGTMEKTLKRCKELLDNNIPILVFPEGTRSRNGGLQPFKNGFFEFAVANQSNILPCALHNCKSLWPLNSIMPDSGEAYVCIGDPIKAKGYSPNELKELCWQKIYEMQQFSPAFNLKTDQPSSQLPEKRGHLY